MKKPFILIIVLCVIFIFACDINIFEDMIRDNPNDPGYDPGSDPENSSDLPPVAPGNLTGEFSSNLQTITLYWQDNSDYETGYKIFRAPITGAFNYSSPLEVGIVEDQEIYVDLVEGIPYKYQVCGYNSHGNGTMSNIAEINLARPTVEIECDEYINGDTLVTLTFNEEVDAGSDLLTGEIQITNGEISGGINHPFANIFNFTLHPTITGEGTITIEVDEDAIIGAISGLPNQSALHNITFDDIAPNGCLLDLEKADETGDFHNSPSLWGVVYYDDNIDVTEICINDNDPTRNGTGDPDDPEWTSLASLGILYSGQKVVFYISASSWTTVQVWFRDAAGNISYIGAGSDNVARADIQPPVIDDFHLGGTSDPDYVTANPCNAEFDFHDPVGGTGQSGVVEYQLRDSAYTVPGPVWLTLADDYVSPDIYEITLPGGDGEYDLNLWLRDAVGNVSAYANDDVILDTVAPTVANYATDITPVNGDDDYPINDNITIVFDEAIDTIGSVQLYYGATSITYSPGVYASIYLDPSDTSNKTVIVNPYGSFAYSTEYFDITLTGFEDEAGNTVTQVYEDYSFATEDDPG